MTLKTAFAAGLIGLTTASAAAHAQSLVLTDGATVTFTQNALGAGATGSVSGTIQSGGVSSAFACTYDVVRGQIGGPSACNQILGGALTGGLSVSALEHDIVETRLSVSSQAQASANTRLLDDLATRRVGISAIVDIQAEMQASGATDASSVFGAPSYGAWSSASGNFLDDERFGLERDAKNYVFTAGVDHTVDNWMVGIYGGYLKNDVDLISLDGDLESDGWLIGTYVTRVLDDVFSITATGSYADSQSHLARNAAGTRVTAAFDHREWSASLNGNAFWLLAPRVGLTGTVGLSYDHWNDDEYTDSSGLAFGKSNGENLWGKAGAILTFLGGPFRPYATVNYGRLFTDPDFYAERDRVSVGGGVALGHGRLTGAFEVNTLLLQEDQRDTTVGFHFRLAV